jgi:hypothetical protein
MGLRSYRRSRRELRKFLREVSLADEIISKTTAKLDGTNKNETNTNLIQNDQHHISVGVNGRLRHHQLQLGFAIRGRLQTAPR